MSNPIEVNLVKQVKGCRTCKWFWGDTPPYGDFPMYDWNEDFPEKIRNQHQTLDSKPKEGVNAKSCGQGQVSPGIMHGCRKAPIMTIGINPNLTSYYASSKSARWAYPNFSNDARYAYYYRHHNVYQESMSLDLIKDNIIVGTELIAEKDGWLIEAERSSDHRWMLLTIQYEGDDEPTQIEVSWSNKERFVVLVDRSYKIIRENPGFNAGAIIGAKLADFSADDVQLYENPTGYYQRYVEVLNRFQKMMYGPVSEADLSISEDVAQHDMIACASPGWSDKYDIPRDRITQNCAIDNAWLIAQLVQTKPALIVIVGASSLEMFVKIFAPFLPSFEYTDEVDDGNGGTKTVIKNTFLLLNETTEKEKFLEIKIGDFELKSRIVLSPHFSYGDNFAAQSRFSPTAWLAFREDYPKEARFLQQRGDKKSIKENVWDQFQEIAISKDDEDYDSLKSVFSVSAWNVLMAYHYEPINMLADVIKQEYEAGRITYDERIKRLKRTEGSCKFCVNDLWQFPEGCPYGKDKETSPAAGALEAVVKEIVRRGKELQR